MANANDFLTKAHVQYLVQYFLYGAEPTGNFVSDVPIRQRCDKAETKLTRNFRKILQDKEGNSEEYGQLMDNLTCLTNATFEAGLLSGIHLMGTIWAEIDQIKL